MTEQNSKVVFLYVTAPDTKIAQMLARTMISEGLAACVNILGETQSVYEWQGKVEETREISMLVKTTDICAAKARDRILTLHPHDTPCIAAMPIQADGSNPEFLNWIRQTTNP